MQHGSRSHSSRLVPSYSAPLLFVTTIVVFLLTTLLATTNQSQHNLYHLHHHQSKQAQRKKRLYKLLLVPSTVAKLQRKLSDSKKSDDILRQTKTNHVYMQLLSKISKEFGGKVVCIKAARRGNFHNGKESDFDGIVKNETDSATTILCILLILEVNRRVVETSCKSNLKKPQAKTCLNGFSGTTTVRKATAIMKPSTSPLSVAFRHSTGSPVNTLMGKCSLQKNNAYEHCFPRQIVNAGKTESETTLGTTVVTSDDGIIKVDQDHQQNHIHASLVSGSSDIEGRRLVTHMMKRRQRDGKVKEHIYFPAKWDSQREWVDDGYAFQPEFCGNLQKRNTCISPLEIKEKLAAKRIANEFLVQQEAEEKLGENTIITTAVAPGVAFYPVTFSKSKMGMLTTVFLENSESSFSLPVLISSPSTTFSKSNMRLVITTGILTKSPTLTRSPPEKVDGFEIEVLEMSTLVFSIVVTPEKCIAVPVQVIIIVVTTIIRRKEVDSYLHHHHFSVLFSSTCSANNSLTTNGLLVSCFSSPLIFPVADFVPTLSIMSTSTTISAPVTNRTAMNTTSFQPLFSLRNKANEEDCLPQTLEKRLLRQPSTPSSSSLPQFYSVTVPTTNNNNTCHLPNIHYCSCRCSDSFCMTKSVAR